MTRPTSMAEFHRRFMENQRVTGFGFDTTMHAPCPFCAAPDFLVWRIVETDAALAGREATCAECGRTARYETTRSRDSLVKVELVQVGGEPPPSWLELPPRRAVETTCPGGPGARQRRLAELRTKYERASRRTYLTLETGRRAQREGRSLEANPYGERTVERQAWADGWEMAALETMKDRPTPEDQLYGEDPVAGAGKDA